MHHVHGEQQRDTESRFFDGHFLQLGQRRGARHVQIGAHRPARTRSSSASSSRRVQRFAAAAGALHELADLLVQRHLLEQCLGTGEVLRNGVIRAGQKGDDKAGHCERGDSGSTREIPPRCGGWNLPEAAVGVTLHACDIIRMIVAGACAVWVVGHALAAEPVAPAAAPRPDGLSGAARGGAHPRAKPRPWSSSRSTVARSSWSANERKPMNPASTMKLVTTYSALHLLGPAFTFRTEVLSEAPVIGEALRGDLYVRGGGDPEAGDRRPVAAGQPAARLRHPRDPRRRGARQDAVRSHPARSGANSMARRAAPTTSGPTRCW